MRFFSSILLIFLLARCSYDERDVRSYMQADSTIFSLIRTNMSEDKRLLNALYRNIFYKINKPKEHIIFQQTEKMFFDLVSLQENINSLRVKIIYSVSDGPQYQIENAKISYLLKEEDIRVLELNINAFLKSASVLTNQKWIRDSLYHPALVKENLPAWALILELDNILLRSVSLQKEILRAQIEKTKLPDYSFSKILPVVRSISNVISEGESYNGEIFLVAVPTNPSFIKKITCEGITVPIDSNGSGIISFPVSAEKFDAKGLARKKWIGTMTVDLHGRDTTYTIMGEYFVRRKCRQ